MLSDSKVFHHVYELSRASKDRNWKLSSYQTSSQLQTLQYITEGMVKFYKQFRTESYWNKMEIWDHCTSKEHTNCKQTGSCRSTTFTSSIKSISSSINRSSNFVRNPSNIIWTKHFFHEIKLGRGDARMVP